MEGATVTGRPKRSGSGTLARAAFVICALPVVARASARAARWDRRLTLEQLADRLRAVAPFRSSRLRARPDWLLAVVDRLLPVLPPRRYGLCLRRSLLLLDLWSRCGAEVRLHLGVRRAGESALEAHAWVTAAGAALETSSQGYAEAFEL